MGKLDLNLNFYFMEAMNFNSKLYVYALSGLGWLAMQCNRMLTELHKLDDQH